MAKASRTINLALQGGGAHGAFAWGVLDRLIEDGRIDFEAISATSAGAMNAIALVAGYVEGGPDGAREKLAAFWRRASEAGNIQGPLGTKAWEAFFGPIASDFSPGYFFFDTITRTFSPYQLNPLDINPLRDILEGLIDFERLRKTEERTRLHLSATNVRTGKIKVFHREEITVQAVLASACLPYIFQAVEIDGEHYWDGGYMGNPAIFPLIYSSTCRDVMVVHINPMERTDVPKTAPEIFNRINEISFNSSLMREMRAIAFVTKLIDEGTISSERYSRMLIHAIRADEQMRNYSVATKLSPDWSFIQELFGLGRASADAWLAENFKNLGQRSTVDLAATYL